MPITEDIRRKIALFCNVQPDCVIQNATAETLYEVPLLMAKEGLDEVVCRKLGLITHQPDLREWSAMVKREKNARKRVSIALVGACFGALMGIFPGFTADEFGQRNNTVNYGILFFGFALSGMLGPQVASWVMSGTGSYRSAFLIAAVVALAGFALTFLHRRLAARS